MEQIPEVPKPDITLHCDACSHFVDLHDLARHREYHSALETLKYRSGILPTAVDALVKRRQALLKRLKSKKDGPECPIDSTQLKRINSAFDVLKSYIENTYDEYRRSSYMANTEVQGLALTCSTRCAYAVGICSTGNERWKNKMEDTRVFQDCFGNDPRKCFLAIYDGYHGGFAAEVAANVLHNQILVEMEKFDPRTKCTCTFNMADINDISQYEIPEEYSRPASVLTERGHIHEASRNAIQQIIQTCEERIALLRESTHEAGDVEENNSSSEKQKLKKRPGKSEKNPFDLFAGRMSDAAVKAHRYTDRILSYGKDEMSRVRWSGCSTLTCVIQDTQVHVTVLKFIFVSAIRTPQFGDFPLI